MKRVLAVLTALAAFALPRAARAHEGAGGNLAVGVGIGAPTAISMELAPTPWTAFELAIGMHDIDNGETYGHLVFKGDLARLADGPTVIVPLYLGVGGFIHDRGVTDFGARLPLGVNFDFRRSPIQLFGEVALEAVLASDRLPDQRLAVAGFGRARVWF